MSERIPVNVGIVGIGDQVRETGTYYLPPSQFTDGGHLLIESLRLLLQLFEEGEGRGFYNALNRHSLTATRRLLRRFGY